jgi:hypothetical protein
MAQGRVWDADRNSPPRGRSPPSPPSPPPTPPPGPPPPPSHPPYQVAVVQSVSADGRTLTLTQPLQFPHYRCARRARGGWRREVRWGRGGEARVLLPSSRGPVHQCLQATHRDLRQTCSDASYPPHPRPLPHAVPPPTPPPALRPRSGPEYACEVGGLGVGWGGRVGESMRARGSSRSGHAHGASRAASVTPCARPSPPHRPVYRVVVSRVMSCVVPCRVSCHVVCRTMSCLVSCRASYHVVSRVMSCVVPCRVWCATCPGGPDLALHHAALLAGRGAGPGGRPRAHHGPGKAWEGEGEVGREREREGSPRVRNRSASACADPCALPGSSFPSFPHSPCSPHSLPQPSHQGRLSGVLGYQLGQRNVRGAYPFHWWAAGRTGARGGGTARGRVGTALRRRAAAALPSLPPVSPFTTLHPSPQAPGGRRRGLLVRLRLRRVRLVLPM